MDAVLPIEQWISMSGLRHWTGYHNMCLFDFQALDDCIVEIIIRNRFCLLTSSALSLF